MRKRVKQPRAQRSLLPSEWPELPEDYATSRERISPEELFGEQLRNFGIEAVPQLRFAKSIGRAWRFDWAIPAFCVAVEIEGLVIRRLAGQLVVYGRHATPNGIIEDMEKYNCAILLGWRVLRFPQTYVKPRHAIDMTLRVLASCGWKDTSGET